MVLFGNRLREQWSDKASGNKCRIEIMWIHDDSQLHVTFSNISTAWSAKICADVDRMTLSNYAWGGIYIVECVSFSVDRSHRVTATKRLRYWHCCWSFHGTSEGIIKPLRRRRVLWNHLMHTSAARENRFWPPQTPITITCLSFKATECVRLNSVRTAPGNSYIPFEINRQIPPWKNSGAYLSSNSAKINKIGSPVSPLSTESSLPTRSVSTSSAPVDFANV
jgi:hypothetical protein